MPRLRHVFVGSVLALSTACAAIYGVGDLPSDVGATDGGADAASDRHAADAPRAHDSGHDGGQDALRDTGHTADATDARAPSDTSPAHDATEGGAKTDAGDAAPKDGASEAEAAPPVTITSVSPSPAAIRQSGTATFTVTLAQAASSDLALSATTLPTGVTVMTAGTITQGTTTGMLTLAATASAAQGLGSWNVTAGSLHGTFPLVVEGASGTLDTSFNESGVQNIVPSGGDTSATPSSIAVQANGAFLIAGTVSSSPTGAWALVRLNEDGTPDTAFNANVVNSAMGALLPGSGHLAGVAVEPGTQRIVVAGLDTDQSLTELTVLLYNPDGSRYEAFGTNGMYQRGPEVDFHVTTVMGVATDPAGDIAVVGNTTDGYILTLSGATNAAFNLGGGYPGTVSLEGVTYAPNGQWVVGGHTPSGGGQFYVAAVNASLAVADYGDAGLFGPPSGGSNQFITASAIASDTVGNVFLVGTDDEADPKGVVTSIASTGQDQTPSGWQEPGVSFMDQDGYVGVACGGIDNVAVVVGTGYDMIGNIPYVERIKGAGGLDTSFGGSGYVQENESTSPSYNAVALDPEGRIIVAGVQAGGFYVTRIWP